MSLSAPSHQEDRLLRRAIWTAVLATLLAGAWTSSHGAANCNVPVPPPVCHDEGEPPPTYTPAMTLLRPYIAGSGYDYYTIFAVYVRPQFSDETRVARLVIDMAPTVNGPWRGWHNTDVPPSSPWQVGAKYPFYAAHLPYTPPLAVTCFRAKFLAANGDYSPWSAAKCASSAPMATQVRHTVGINAVTVSWVDNSFHDNMYYVEMSDPDGSNPQMHPTAGNGGYTGERQLTIPRAYRQTAVCIRVWAVEQLPGLVGYLPSGDFSDSSPLNTAIYPTARVCVETPGV